MKGVQVAVCGMKCTDLINETIKVLGAYFSYNQKIKDDKNFYNISNIQGVLNLWRMINLTLEGRIVIFKTFAILNSLSSSFNQNPPPSCQRVGENTKIFSLERLYSENKT